MKISEIKASINKVLKDGATNIPIMSNDVKEGYNSPSFFVTFTSSKRIAQNKHLFKRELDVRIHYFPKSKDDYSIECYNMQDTLENLFGMYLKIGKRTMTLGETESFIQDQVLMVDFSIEFYETYEESIDNDCELMQTLHLKTEIK